MPFQGHALAGISPYIWVGLGIAGRWLYGRWFDAPAASVLELVMVGTIIGTACYALVVFVPILLELLAKRRGK